MGAGASAEAFPVEMHMECIQENEGIQAVNEILGLAGDETNNPLSRRRRAEASRRRRVVLAAHA